MAQPPRRGASALSPEQRRAFREGWKRRAEKHAKRLQELAAEARTKAAMAAKHLRQHYGVKRVLLFGSLARGDFRTDSDIDLCVDALPPHLFYAVYAQLERIVCPFDLDLLVLEDLDRPEHRDLKASILRDGVELP